MATIEVDELDIKQPLDYKKDEKVIKAIRQCASTPDDVSATLRAQRDIARLNMTLEGICEGIVAWIDDGKEILRDIAVHEEHVGKFLYVMHPEIAGVKRYVKVQLDEDTGSVYIMVVVSAHEK